MSKTYTTITECFTRGIDLEVIASLFGISYQEAKDEREYFEKNLNDEEMDEDEFQELCAVADAQYGSVDEQEIQNLL